MRTRHRLVATTVALLTSFVLAGCGSDSETEEAPLTKEQIDSALLTVADVGTGFQIKPKDEDEDDTDLGCLSTRTSIKDGFPGATESVDVTIEAIAAPNVPEVGNQINVFEDLAAAKSSLEDFVASLEGCKSVDETNEGIRFVLEIETNDLATTDDVDEQFNLDFTGVLSGEGIQIPVSQRARFMRIGNVITATYFSSFAANTADDADRLAELVLAKILPIIEGDPAGAPASLDLEPFTG